MNQTLHRGDACDRGITAAWWTLTSTNQIAASDNAESNAYASTFFHLGQGA